jgi:lipopolysaccharide export system protein LptA
MAFFRAAGQEIIWKGKELISGNYKLIEGEIIIRTPEDTIKASKAKLYNEPEKKAVLSGDLRMDRKGMQVTGDSGIYFPRSKKVWVMGRARITSEEGDIRSEAFQYDLNSGQLISNTFTSGSAEGIRFSSARSIIFKENKNIKLIGNAIWENDTIKGLADTVYLNKQENTLKMSRNAKILFKKKKDEVAGSFIEIDLKSNKITKITGSKIKRDDFTLKARKINQTDAETYFLEEDVEIKSSDEAVSSTGKKALIRKKGMKMEGETMTRLLDKDKKEIRIYSPVLTTDKGDSVEKYHFFLKTNIRGEFDGFADSIYVRKKGKERETFLYRNAHLQNDSLFLEGDTLEMFQDSLKQIIRAKRNAMMIMISKPNRVNYISAAYIQLTKTDSLSELYSTGDSESFLWNDEKNNVGLNHTIAPVQKAKIRNKKVSRVNTRGATKSVFQPLEKVDYGYLNTVASRLKESYKADTLPPGLNAVPDFLTKIKKLGK